ncbi:acyl-CoA dehydrogenase family protein [Rhodococcus qingshengii]|uniref:acyl-CoA dehydrogenase family protein n=1 Tax=Rhodococcus qingshengii TaxID=334542 RepID=UPI0010A5FD84|nr:acyl-CoA dehydrogenase family protein [Rhodococcus qingshengii]THJ67666.1 acyl-CoA dehydrogenase [Rhodococcus qingshengii]
MSEQDTLRELVVDLVEAENDSGHGDTQWAMFDEAGLFAVGIDEAIGGSGGTVGDLVVIAEAAGSTGSTIPFIEFSIARWILAASNNPRDAGTRSTAVLVDLQEEDILTGTHTIEEVAGASSVDTIVLCTSHGAIVALSTSDPGVRIEAMSNLAHGSSDTVVISGSAERHVLDGTISQHAIADRFALLRAAALSGAVRGAYELTRGYVRTREQFGAPLVKLPAVASGIATMRTKVLESKAAVDAALKSDSSIPALAARVVSARCATDAARLAHQLHGAMGTTREYPLHKLTTALWAWRDADRSETTWSQLLGERIVTDGEVSAWDTLEGSLR